MSPVWPSSRPQTRAGTDGTRSRTCDARAGSSVTRTGLETASAISGSTPSRHRRTSYRRSRKRPASLEPAGPSRTTPRRSPCLSGIGVCSITKRPSGAPTGPKDPISGSTTGRNGSAHLLRLRVPRVSATAAAIVTGSVVCCAKSLSRHLAGRREQRERATRPRLRRRASGAEPSGGCRRGGNSLPRRACRSEPWPGTRSRSRRRDEPGP